MRWISIIILIALLYGTTKQQLYFSSSQQKNPDERVVILGNFLSEKESPLAGSSATFIHVSDASGLDWRLLPAIAGVESGFEKNGNVHDYNPFGYMCVSSPCAFLSYQQAIETVAKTISGGNAYARFRKSGSLLDLAKVYNYVYPQDWAEKVEYFERQLSVAN